MRIYKKAVTAFITASMAASLAGCAQNSTFGGGTASGSSDTVAIAVLYPETGQYAEYGKMFKQGLDLGAEQVNSDGGVQGKKIELKYYDTQSDPKQSASVAPKIASDSSVVAVVGDYSSGASMAASPTFQQAGLVHYGFNNSAADFTSTGDHVWTPQYSQDDFQSQVADMVAEHAKKISVVYIENDWGKAAYAAFKKEALAEGLDIVYESSFLADSTDLSPILIPARDADPDAIVHVGYGPDGALVINTLRDKLGYTGPFYGGQITNEFISTAGENGEGTMLMAPFTADSTNPNAQQFVKDFRAKYNSEPGEFNETAYAAVIDLAYGMNKTSATREGVQEALETVEDFPCYVGTNTTFSFNQETRRMKNTNFLKLKLENGKFQIMK
ncbi:ABC transporter substrate-binding protein [Bifidobacterium lemurum]|uniref:ABC transporter substrate-binding protein n=1 Tax=Bifidobacterium lemurum TaxID=1603886 RepID=A0A261FRL2_9BIFI|nr:ABC transporter substrate-binding protein [Bifidobacterium lemurum]OZG61797.1 ABC transporter substrate-binding protein [Bifidobacterium lemurum]